MKNKSIIHIIIVATSILLIPLIAMRLTDEVVWSVADFAIVWIILVIIGFGYKLSTKVMDKRKIIYLALLILFGLFLIVFGEYDDSPGAQLLGLIIGILGTIKIIKYIKHKNRP